MKLANFLCHVNYFHFTLIVLLAGFAFGEDDAIQAPTSKMPMPAQLLIDREQAQEKVLKDKMATDIAKLHKDLSAKLKIQKDAAVRNADLEGAEAIKTAIETYAVAKPVEVAPAIDLRGQYKVSKCNWNVTEIDIKDDGLAITSLGDRITWTFESNMLRIVWPDGSISKGEYHPAGIDMQSTGKVASGEDRCNFFLIKQ